MRRTLVAAATFAMLLASSTNARAAAHCPAPRCFQAAVPVPRDLSVPEELVRIVLPPNYSPGGRGYPVLYLLHGAGDTFRTWTNNTDLVSFTAKYQVIVVMPDGGANSNAGWYSDWVDGSRDWETFHTRVLIPWVDRHFNTLGARHRAVAGLSMGGFGAMSYTARHPGMFAAAASFSGAVDTQYVAPVSGLAFAELHDRYGTPDDRVWGDQTQDAATWSGHNPTALASRLKCTPLWLTSGNGAPGGPAGDDPSNPGGYAIEHFIWQMNQSFVRALDAAGVTHHDEFYGGGYHGWAYWQYALHWALPQLYDAIEPGASVPRCA